MTHYVDLENLKVFWESAIITIGKLEGLHLGHQEIFRQMMKKKKEKGQALVVIFTTNFARKKEAQIYTTKERLVLLEHLGIDCAIDLTKSEGWRDWRAGYFLEEILCKQLKMKEMVIGDDFHFGYQKEGDADFLKNAQQRLNYCVQILQKIRIDEEEVSSSRIYQLIQKGRMEEVARQLGFFFFIKGRVVLGNQIGRTIGVPTINLLPPKKKLLPPLGVYTSKIRLGEEDYFGITNVGIKPTVQEQPIIGVEMHIFDFAGDLYGACVKVEILSFIRAERKFSSFEELVKQMKEDIKNAKDIVEKLKKQENLEKEL